MIAYRFAETADISAIYAIWHEAFPDDTDTDIDEFLKRVELTTQCLVAVENAVPVSMVFMLPATLKTPEREYPLQYIYAAATLTAFRGRGIFGELLQRAHTVAKEKGCAGSFLRPAQPSLFGYYARFGYEPYFYCETVRGRAQAIPVSYKEMSAQAYKAACEPLLPAVCVTWDAAFSSYGTTAVQFSNTACALCSKRDATLFIPEWIGETDGLSERCAGLAHRFGCADYCVRIPAKHKETCFGMLKTFAAIPLPSGTVPFMGFALD